MSTYIYTIEELNQKPTNELQEIFRKATEIAAAKTCPAQEQEAAKRTLENVRRSLAARFGPN